MIGEGEDGGVGEEETGKDEEAGKEAIGGDGKVTVGRCWADLPLLRVLTLLRVLMLSRVMLLLNARSGECEASMTKRLGDGTRL